MRIVCAEMQLHHALADVAGNDAERTVNLERALYRARVTLPTEMLLDVRVGGNTRRAVDWVPAFHDAAPGVDVILLSPHPSDAEIAEADAIGAYHIVDVAASGWQSEVRVALSVARLTAALRQGRAGPSSVAPHRRRAQ